VQGLCACCQLHLRRTGSHQRTNDRMEGSTGSSDTRGRHGPEFLVQTGCFAPRVTACKHQRMSPAAAAAAADVVLPLPIPCRQCRQCRGGYDVMGFVLGQSPSGFVMCTHRAAAYQQCRCMDARLILLCFLALLCAKPAACQQECKQRHIPACKAEHAHLCVVPL
jgi:hypothetical protein